MESTGKSQSPPKLTLSTKLAYGAGDMGAGLTSNLLIVSFSFFLIKVVGLDPWLAGCALIIGKIWDLVNDPLVGMLSDRTKTRWGRRYPWIALTAIPFGVTFYFVWIIPSLDSQVALFSYYVLVAAVFQTFFTTTNLPYSTLTAEMTEDYDSRTELTSFRLAFSLIGAVLILVLGAVISEQVESLRRQYQILSILGGVVAIATTYWCVFGTFGHYQRQAAYVGRSLGSSQEGENDSFLEQLKIVLRNRPFWFVVGIYLFSWLALQITATVLPYYVVFWMENPNYFVALLLVQGIAIIMLFVCNFLSKRIGKKGVYFLGSGIWILVQLGLFLLQPGQLGVMYLLCVVASFGVATTYVVPWSILPDVIELNELKTGRRSEGAFYSFMTLLQKLGLAGGIFLFTLALEYSGFDKDLTTQSESALLAIRLFIGPVPLLLLVGGMILTYFYPITKASHAETLLKLSERRSRQAQEGV